MCVVVLLYVSLYYYIYVSAYWYIYVLLYNVYVPVLLYVCWYWLRQFTTDCRLPMCPSTTKCALVLLYMCPRTTICGFVLLHLCPRTTIYVWRSLVLNEAAREYYYVCVLILLCMCLHTTMYQPAGMRRGEAVLNEAAREYYYIYVSSYYYICVSSYYYVSDCRHAAERGASPKSFRTTSSSSSSKGNIKALLGLY
jgi:hypothetical protein